MPVSSSKQVGNHLHKQDGKGKEYEEGVAESFKKRSDRTHENHPQIFNFDDFVTSL
jgi:hypothetical protein